MRFQNFSMGVTLIVAGASLLAHQIWREWPVFYTGDVAHQGVLVSMLAYCFMAGPAFVYEALKK